MPVELKLPEIDISQLKGKVAIITGGTSGVGLATASQLALRGCTVVVTSRSQARGDETANELCANLGLPNESVVALALDLGSLTKIREFAAAFKEKYDRLDFLIHNAGTPMPSKKPTPDGLEDGYNQRVAAPHAITSLLWDLLVKSGSRSDPSRVTVTNGFALKDMKWTAEEFRVWLRDNSDGKIMGKTPCTDPPTCDTPCAMSPMVSAFGWCQALGKRCGDTVPVVFVATHPGMCTDTNLMGRCGRCLLPVVALFTGGHTKDKACLANVAACLMPAYTEIKQGALLGPLNHTSGPPSVVLVNEASTPDAAYFKCESGPAMLDVGEMAVKEVAERTGRWEILE